MVWPFSSSSSNNDSSDPYSKLDPALREILNRDSRSTSTTPSTPHSQPPPPTQPTLEQEPSASQSTSPPTLFPDGRYAHLWKTYRPQSSIESEHKSDQERLADVLTTWKDRKATISKAALENCAAVNMELDACWRKPSLGQRFSMCREESRALDRCVTMNQRFLKTLGYLSSLERTPQQQEEIQMHADRLYQRMLAKERDGVEARKDGTDVAVVDKEGLATRPPELENLTDHGKRQLEDRLKGLSPAERDLEERAFAAEIRAGVETMQQVEKYRAEARRARTERLEAGNARPSDKLQSWLGR